MEPSASPSKAVCIDSTASTRATSCCRDRASCVHHPDAKLAPSSLIAGVAVPALAGAAATAAIAAAARVGDRFCQLPWQPHLKTCLSQEEVVR